MDHSEGNLSKSIKQLFKTKNIRFVTGSDFNDLII
jgi:hypothetical protein